MPPSGDLTRDDVLAAIGRERSLTAGSAPWTLRFVDVADRQFGGRWRRVTLTGADALAIVLPPHAGEPCQGDRLQLVDPGGATVEAAARRLARIRTEYETTNRSCWRRIEQAAAAPFSTLVLTTSPLAADDYIGVSAESGRLFHLDGFHRLVAWAWAGRLRPGATIHAIVAGGDVTHR